MSFVSAFSTTTGEKQRVPAHWLEDPVLGGQFRKTPSQEAADQTLSPFDAYTVPQLQEYAAQHDIDVSGLTRKAELVAAVSKSGKSPS